MEKEKNDSVINVRLPENMKKQLKEKLGYNMSGIMKEHFQKILDATDCQKKNACFLCKEHKKYNECSYGTFIDKINNKIFISIFCNECLNKTMDDYQDVEEVRFVKFLMELTRQNTCEVTLKDISEEAYDNQDVYEIGKGFFSFINSKIEEEENTDSTQTHNSEASNLTSIGTESTNKKDQDEAEEINGQ